MIDIQKLREVIEQRLKMVEEDERLSYPSADIFSNAPLALIQLELETERDTLKRILKYMDSDNAQNS